ncbi:RNA dependent RNA polymerase [Plasmopara viticola lesion associated ourmia-like virus 59]|uniref:RNA dependent RNA polymerase n=1 Tax=Plasmopara viticola lesion associated ourmia-like virus 59 TaxID=2686530 RepID=A0ABX6FJ09_9VIRU|nr:RNA dependent RNA polymerase [Plasmopara viticola lesion associated ourmia-like virus 59]QGY72589.1 RNA dependent RNA polymerase [Plasmopara viticola lesion associated ourmia-like virus 59]
MSAGSRAREAWQNFVAQPANMPECDWSYDPLWLLKRRVRELTEGWGSKLEGRRKDFWSGNEWGLGKENGYVPDQQGCFEVKRRSGGTLAAPAGPCKDFSGLRVGIAKTKGKFRVVTMQPAYVKRVLRPVHEALYDHLTDKGWCVRGDVTRQDFDAVFDDLKSGERIISGDYEQATNLIYLDAVEVIVSTIAEEPRLTEEEKKVLIGSFRDIRWVSKAGVHRPLNRGSMMGNLISFPLLCLLNKACHDIARDIHEGSDNGRKRLGRFNGDDCMFPGSLEFYHLWRRVTGTYGLKVNEKKTGFRRNMAELNSQPCFRGKKGLNPKPVISFLRPFREEPDGLLWEVYSGIKSLKFEVQALIWNVYMRHEISLRPLETDCLPGRTLQYLLKKSWFRRAIQIGPAPIKRGGVSRTIPMTVQNPPLPEFYPVFDDAARRLKKGFVEFWTGKVLGESAELNYPEERRLDRRAFHKENSKTPTRKTKWTLKRGERRWQFVWPKHIWDIAVEKYPECIMTDDECLSPWHDDHPCLTTRAGLIKDRLIRPPKIPVPQSLLGEVIPMIREGREYLSLQYCGPYRFKCIEEELEWT